MKKTYVGGQAVIEGVMMRHDDEYAIAVRKPDQEIEVKVEKYDSFMDRHSFAKLPIIRGVVNFVESLLVGMQTLTYSASFYEEEEGEPSGFFKWLDDKTGGKGEDLVMGATMCFSVVLAIAIFMILPYLLTGFLDRFIDSHLVITLLEGVVRIAIFLIYIVLISQMKDIQRVFMYHGAEHKTINCMEHGEDLTPENAMKYSRLHKRCGTSFLLIVMIVSILFFMFIQVDKIWLKIVLRILLVPVIAGVSYEFIRLAGRSENKIVTFLSKPGMMLQKLTTREPDKEMLEVAIKAVEGVFDWKPYVKAVREGTLE
ncbi:MAG: DUF1385 domain-containing protein [Lachnospiraceae bacterium]|nr:DUF1385 domain-containing protein [Lachnospiraceae bacterium]